MSHNTQILGLSAKKQGGKTTTTNFILGTYLTYLELITEQQYDQNNKVMRHSGGFSITERGELWISNIEGDTNNCGVFDYFHQSEALDTFKKEKLDPYIKIYSFADLLKKEVCMKILGLTYEQCYGTNYDKDSRTHLCWEDMPGIMTKDFQQHCIDWQSYTSHFSTPEPKTGRMTAREVLQYVGTDIFRKMYGNVWVDALMRQIQTDNPVVAIITDVRFPNEVYGIKEAGGHVIRFTRAPFAEKDEHESEKALDIDKFDWNEFYRVIDNADVTIKEHCALVYAALAPLGVIPDMYADILKKENL